MVIILQTVHKSYEHFWPFLDPSSSFDQVLIICLGPSVQRKLKMDTLLKISSMVWTWSLHFLGENSHITHSLIFICENRNIFSQPGPHINPFHTEMYFFNASFPKTFKMVVFPKNQAPSSQNHTEICPRFCHVLKSDRKVKMFQTRNMYKISRVEKG